MPEKGAMAAPLGKLPDIFAPRRRGGAATARSGAGARAEASVSWIPADRLEISGPAARDRKAGAKTLSDLLPIQKGVYRVVLDYTDPAANHLYLVDTRDDRVTARYVSNGGKQQMTDGAHWTVDFEVHRPTWSPTRDELAENPDFKPNGPGPSDSMGLIKLHMDGAEYIHGIEDARIVGGIVEPLTSSLDALGSAHSHGCWNMSNPNVVELAERFGVGPGTDVTILRPGDPTAQKTAAALAKDMASQGLGDRRLSAGLGLLEADYRGAHKYLSPTPYKTRNGQVQPPDAWYLKLWEKRRALGA